MIAAAGYVQEEMLVRTVADPPRGTTTSQSGPGKLLANGAAGTPGSGLFAEAVCAVAPMASEAMIAKRYCDLFRHIDITPGARRG